MNFSKKDKNILLAYIIGVLIEFLLFQILAIPFTFLKLSFKALRMSWTIGILVLFTCSIILNMKNFKDIIQENLENIKKLPKILTVIFFVLLLLQGYKSFRYMYEDYDDSNFVAKATVAKDTNTLFVYDDMGEKYESFPTRHVFSPFPCFTANISDIIDIHPAIVAHTIFPVFFLLVGYTIFYLIGLSLFKNDRKKVIVFMIILSLLYIFGDYTRYSIFVRLLCRAWQGKSLLANITIPFILYIFLEYIGTENDGFYWVLLFITLWSADLFSSMSIFLPLIEAGLFVILYSVKYKEKKYILKFLPCCLPNLIYGIMYFVIK